MLKEQRTTAMHKTEERLMEDHTVSLNGVDLHYRTIGAGSVLFLVSPGWGVASPKSSFTVAQNICLKVL